MIDGQDTDMFDALLWEGQDVSDGAFERFRSIATTFVRLGGIVLEVYNWSPDVVIL